MTPAVSVLPLGLGLETFLHDVFPAVVATLLGLVIGSFLNVVIWRLPRGENLAVPRSRCPGCGQEIRWFDNIPVLSWLLLRARCRTCKTPIAWRYPLVEALTGVLFLLAWWQFRDHLPTASVVALALATLVAISFIDLDHRIIPDRLSKPGMALALATAPFLTLYAARNPDGFLAGVPHPLDGWLWSLAGLLAGGAIIHVVRAVGSWILKKEAMGLGDVKLLAFAGALVGPLEAVYVMVLGCMAGAGIGGMAFLIGKRRPMPARVTVSGPEARSVTFDRVRLRDGVAWFRDAPDWPEGSRLELAFLLPASRILEDEDAEAGAKGTLRSVADGRWVVDLAEPRKGKAAQLAAERLWMFSQSYRYIPFGPFLSVGAAAMLLFGTHVTWFLREGYPAWVRSTMGL